MPVVETAVLVSAQRSATWQAHVSFTHSNPLVHDKVCWFSTTQEWSNMSHHRGMGIFDQMLLHTLITRTTWHHDVCHS
eukprot:m.801978 g.801978  ORF g.801978 m.801978 type:complete len:78 (+) comp23361_c1_seq29:1514-1747(+)